MRTLPFATLALAVVGLAAASQRAPGAQPAEPVPSDSRQLVLSVSAGWDASRARLQAYERPASAEAWVAIGGPFEASLGRTGLGWGRGLHAAGQPGPQKKEGDGRSPAGVFELRQATGYDAVPPPGVRLPYREATPTLRCVDDPRSRFYNQLVDEASLTRDWSSAEEMRRGDALYERVVWVGHNDSPVEPGGGSCIFLHLRAGPESVTAGCTAFDPAAMEQLLRWLDPSARPVLVQLPAAELDARAAAWRLPARRPRADRAAPLRPQGSAAER